MYICSIYDIRERERVGRSGTTKTGPNDTRRVVWALGELLYYYYFVLLILINILCLYL